MEARAGMLAQLFERSMGLGPEWRVEDVWFEEREGAPDELHVRVGRVPGQVLIFNRNCADVARGPDHRTHRELSSIRMGAVPGPRKGHGPRYVSSGRD